ncbi:NAD-dependent epimerase/dehydratase family protein [Prescottella equi]|uniref:NAD-dependent epimerase/dehydratase family protein n=1 Tax=Rhodococcus hoagii TaxID=43767 RepID=UPI0009BF2A14|nr:NAD(P)-dependent oxidoreductase [Prescottella equi]MBM4535275.1 NAD-dependent epimerase/dehydratase family protein [Prescottella equi]MBM4607245.1 NAD-dependent epimerase/dehydratase family protein [Prescottella equi]MCA1004868.1 NAD(P)-dependent oxidoreductase [Prescottella equi]NKR83513.1 NAD-dependent epimerase/dehydratase family protein [Prescottella equi]NKS41592.1 NAD-dependent epimerase/dehydratase family protein [Prescottella equi]
MLSGEKILVTGAAGQIAFPIARELGADNEVWGLARFSKPEDRQRLVDVGITPVKGDVGSGDFADLPTDFTYVVHLAANQAPGWDYDTALRDNAEGTGLLLQHCRNARGALVMSTHSVYRPQEDPMYVFTEESPLGECNSTHSPTYSVSKIGQEATARLAARAFGVPVTIARMNASYGPNGGLPALHVDAIAAGRQVTTRWDPCMYSPIFEDDINSQVSSLLQAATVPATIVNWAGDEPVSVQEWATYAGELMGVDATVGVVPIEGTLRGSIADTSRRLSITGPCTVDWREGLRRTIAVRHPDKLVEIAPS